MRSIQDAGAAVATCRIARIVRRTHWFSPHRRGVFVALVPAPHRERPIARSPAFALATADAEVTALHTLLAQLCEEGWERWQEPDVPLGIEGSAHGYWSCTLRRVQTPETVDVRLSQWRARSGGQPEMERLRERAIERFRQQGYQIGAGCAALADCPFPGSLSLVGIAELD